jgi:hypothetical protein
MAAALPAWAAAPATAQNALGDGRALDANLSVQGTRNRPKADFRQELSLRNSIVTGNAPGGLSFRGDAGYTAPGEFRGELGSDDLFAFRRDSVYSGLGGQGIRGTSALQYQFALTTGSAPPRNLFGGAVPGGFVSRDEGGTPGFGYQPSIQASPAGGLTTAARPQQLDLRAVDGATDSLRSVGSYTATRGLQASLLGTFKVDQFGQQTYGVSASDLRGLRASPLREEQTDAPRPTAAPTTASNRVNLALDRIGAPSTGLPSDPLAAGAAEFGARGVQDMRAPTTAYDQVVARIRARAEQAIAASAAGAPDEPESWWQEQLRILREQLLTPPEDVAAPLAGETAPGTSGTGAEADPSTADAPRGIRDAIDLLRDAGAPVSTLVEGVSETDAYLGHMRVGEAELAAGRYFNAEERFTRALTVRAKDVTAQVGRVHAQLGAGLFISAALNLRQVFVEQPEVVTTRYAATLLPAPARTGELVALLQQNIGAVPRADGLVLADVRLERESGFLLAYLGWQTAQPALVEQGLAAAKRTLTTDARPTDADGVDARVLSLLERAWVVPAGGPADGPADGK